MRGRWQARSRSGLRFAVWVDDLRHFSRDSAMLVADVCPGCQQGGPEMIIDCAHYQDGRRQEEGAVPLEEAAARCGQGG